MTTHNVSLGELLTVSEAVQAARLGNLTPPQYDVLAGFRFTYLDDLFNVNKQIAQAQKDLTYWTLVDNSYIDAQKDLMALQAARLLVKAANISGTASVQYSGAHPSNGGTNPAGWSVVETFTLWNTASPKGVDDTHGPFTVTGVSGTPIYVESVDYTAVSLAGSTTFTWLAGGSPTVKIHFGGLPDVVYSHGVNWDSDVLLAEWENSWTQLGFAPSSGARYNIYWGSHRNIDAFNLALLALNDLKTIINGREQASGDLGIRKYIPWATESPINTRQPAVTVATVDERQVFTVGVEYTFTPDEVDPTVFNLEALTDDNDVVLLPATVRVRA